MKAPIKHIPDSRRYYLHKRVKKLYKIDAKAKTVFIPFFDANGDIPEIVLKHLRELASIGYNLQIVIE